VSGLANQTFSAQANPTSYGPWNTARTAFSPKRLMIYFPRSSEPRKGDQLTPCAAAGGWTEIESRGQESEGGRCNTTLGARWNPAALQNGVAKQRREQVVV